MTELKTVITEVVNGTEITYILDRATETYLPEIEIPKQKNLGRYGKMRAEYLKENHSGIYQSMLMCGTLNSHCAAIEETAYSRIDIIVKAMAKADDLSEEMKNSNPLKWAGLMNNYKSCAEEIVFDELIYR